jgi:hypothetical protein
MKTMRQAEKDGTIRKPKGYIDLFGFRVSGKGRAHVRKGKTAKDHKSGAHARRIVNQMKREAAIKDGGKK